MTEHEVGGTIRANSSTISTARSFALRYLGSICGFKNPEEHTTEWFERAMAAARAEERERCAKIAYRTAKEFARQDLLWLDACSDVAAAIRKEPS
jgi:hypothetical protein